MQRYVKLCNLKIVVKCYFTVFIFCFGCDNKEMQFGITRIFTHGTSIDALP